MTQKNKKFDGVTTIREACLVVGYLLFGYGVWLIFPPAAYIVCGALLVSIGFPRVKGGD